MRDAVSDKDVERLAKRISRLEVGIGILCVLFALAFIYVLKHLP
jgi:hypothetical protein